MPKGVREASWLAAGPAANRSKRRAGAATGSVSRSWLRPYERVPLAVKGERPGSRGASPAGSDFAGHERRRHDTARFTLAGDAREHPA